MWICLASIDPLEASATHALLCLSFDRVEVSGESQ